MEKIIVIGASQSEILHIQKHLPVFEILDMQRDIESQRLILVDNKPTDKLSNTRLTIPTLNALQVSYVPKTGQENRRERRVKQRKNKLK